MEDVTLILKAHHVPALRNAVREYAAKSNESSTPEQDAIVTDLLNRVDLFAHMIAAEAEAKRTRAEYHYLVHKRYRGKTQPAPAPDTQQDAPETSPDAQ